MFNNKKGILKQIIALLLMASCKISLLLLCWCVMSRREALYRFIITHTHTHSDGQKIRVMIEILMNELNAVREA